MLQPTVPAWFEIPSRDFDRAVRFYESVLEATLAREETPSMRMAVFPHVKPQPTGAVVRAEGYEPATAGTVVYLAVDDIRPVLGRVPKAGGAVTLPLTPLPEGMGVFAQIRDTEGNRVGLFSAK
ncbi:MAG TPA: VOC family protein [Vicinamibacteria bacterium]|nr:VOC family protein [Vicinamibacteria bacterium]